MDEKYFIYFQEEIKLSKNNDHLRIDQNATCDQ